MAYGQRNGHDQSSLTCHRLARIHQRIVQRMARGILRVRDGSKVQLGRGTEQDDVKIALSRNLLVGAVRVSVLRDRSDDAPGFLVESLEITVPGNANRVECLSRHGDGRRDVYRIVVNHLPVLVPPVTELLDFIRRTKNGVQVIQKEGTALCLRFRIRLCAVHFAGHGNPGIMEIAEEKIVLLPLPGVNIDKMLHACWNFCATFR